jgi:hypothetical protein
MLRGREAVRADRRLRTDEKRIRAQSTISYKRNPKPSLFLSITAFSVRMVFIRTENAVGARSAQVGWWDATAFETPYTNRASANSESTNYRR